ncbi:MBL fold metallo-hydrolase [Ruminococcus albus]|uniref:Ribonuclease BN, tRNA processing enzyme n=1 Tax=Ruminococcus albus TaxID=1264 RepID=A0A1I1KMB3_RUMAL|nr:MBL fold metallo-hydrolase [Ruminococcus albus]SFC61422.1 Ribonuclease BN, tRNA processing enzyme [Ruminococcus albus]
MLKFLGRGSAFHTDNNCAFFMHEGRLVLLDCPMSAFHKMRKTGAETLAGCRPENITVLITHTHSDHIGGLGMLVHFSYFVWHIPVVVVAANDEIRQDISFVLERLDGCESSAYTIISPDGTGFTPVAVRHAIPLEGRCFGWSFYIDGQQVVFTGDTCSLEPFMPYLTEGTYLYTEVSAYNSPVHLHIDKLRALTPELVSRNIKVFIMHLDDEKSLCSAAEEIGAVPAPLYVQL